MSSPVDKFSRLEGQTEALPDLRKSLAKGTPKTRKEEAHKTGRKVPDSSLYGLSKKQIAILGQTSKKAFELQDALGLIPDGIKAPQWRRLQRIEATGTDSMSQTCQHHWPALISHFRALAGDTSIQTFNGLTDTGDFTARANVLRKLRNVIAEMAETQNKGQKMRQHAAESYAFTIAKSRAKGLAPKDLSAVFQTFPIKTLWSIFYTLRNRLNAWQGLGQTSNRNKSQRTK